MPRSPPTGARWQRIGAARKVTFVNPLDKLHVEAYDHGGGKHTHLEFTILLLHDDYMTIEEQQQHSAHDG